MKYHKRHRRTWLYVFLAALILGAQAFAMAHEHEHHHEDEGELECQLCDVCALGSGLKFVATDSGASQHPECETAPAPESEMSRASVTDIPTPEARAPPSIS